MAKELIELDKKHVWHPFTQMKDWGENEQLLIERGEGVYLYDANGNKYIDGVSSLWVTIHGHRKREIDAAVKKQLNKISHSTLLGLANEPSTLLAEKLINIAPKGLKKVFFSDNGSTAVEIALKIAFQYWQNNKSNPLSNLPRNSGEMSAAGGQKGLMNEGYKTKFITLKNAYHGDTIGSVSVGGIDLFHKIYKPLLFKSIMVMPDEKEIEKAMKRHHRKVAAIIMEPLIQAAAGMLIQKKGLLAKVRNLCDKYGILLIVDEVATGFGRTGKIFACEHEKVSPDIMCVAKGLTGGYLPIAATLTTQKIFDAFLGGINNTFFHGHTYTGNPLGCAAAIANLELFKKEKTIQKLQPKIAFLKRQLKSFNKQKIVKEIRQCGFMAGIELFDVPGIEQIGRQVILEARKMGAILRPLGNVIVLMPPLCISFPELKKLLEVTYRAISKISKNSI